VLFPVAVFAEKIVPTEKPATLLYESQC